MTTILPIKSNNSKLIRIPNDSITTSKQQPLINSLSTSTAPSTSSSYTNVNGNSGTLSKKDWNSALNSNNQNNNLENNNDHHHRNSGEENYSTSRSNSTRDSINSSNIKSQPQSLSLYQQFLTGTGWFAPLVLPDPEPTRDEREIQERNRIQKLKEGGNNNSRPRPTLRARASSGLEMMGWIAGKGEGV